MKYRYEQLHAEMSLIFASNSSERWSFFCGLGLSAGATFNANTEITHYGSYWIGDSYYSQNIFSQGNYRHYEFQYENFSNRSSASYSAFIPLGIDFRIGKTRPFWKAIHLLLELRPSISILKVPELRTYLRTGTLIAFGVKMTRY
jgi:hypothetical protein